LRGRRSRAIIDASPPLVALLTLAAVLTRGRLNEILSMTWDRIDFDKARCGSTASGRRTAGRRSRAARRTHALPAEQWQALLAHQAESPYDDADDFVFASCTSREIDGRNILRWFKDAAKAAGVTQRGYVHPLRHTAGTRAAELGLSALEVAAMLGHGQASTSERYEARG
jgi:integrase